MMNFKLRAEMLGKTEAEIRSEMASALGRIGRALQDALARLKQANPESPEYRELLKEAKLSYWYMIVQREAIGIRSHDLLIREFDVPPAVR